MSRRKFWLLVFVIMGLLWVISELWQRRANADDSKPIQSWVLVDSTGFKLTKVQDGSCSLYVVSSNYGEHPVGITAGQGCGK